MLFLCQFVICTKIISGDCPYSTNCKPLLLKKYEQTVNSFPLCLKFCTLQNFSKFFSSIKDNKALDKYSLVNKLAS